MQTILDMISFMARHLDQDDIPAAAKCVTIQLRLPSDLDGCRYLRSLIPMYIEDREKFLTKELYVQVGHAFGVSREQVEKNIRYAINVAWKQRDRLTWDPYFPQTRKPSNKEFISRIADVLELWQDSTEVQ